MEKSDEEWNYVLDTNLNGTFRCLRAQLNNIKDGGAIVNVTSVAGMTGCPFDAPYGVSKHGVILSILSLGADYLQCTDHWPHQVSCPRGSVAECSSECSRSWRYRHAYAQPSRQEPRATDERDLVSYTTE